MLFFIIYLNIFMLHKWNVFADVAPAREQGALVLVLIRDGKPSNATPGWTFLFPERQGDILDDNDDLSDFFFFCWNSSDKLVIIHCMLSEAEGHILCLQPVKEFGTRSLE